MDVVHTFNTLALWLNSCQTIEQIELLQKVADNFLFDRCNSEKLYIQFCEAAEIKKVLPASILEPITP